MNYRHKRVKVGTAAVRLDSEVEGQFIQFTPVADIYLGTTDDFVTTNPTSDGDHVEMRFVAGGASLAFDELGSKSQPLAVWVKTASGSTYVDVTEGGVNPW